MAIIFAVAWKLNKVGTKQRYHPQLLHSKFSKQCGSRDKTFEPSWNYSWKRKPRTNLH